MHHYALTSCCKLERITSLLRVYRIGRASTCLTRRCSKELTWEPTQNNLTIDTILPFLFIDKFLVPKLFCRSLEVGGERWTSHLADLASGALEVMMDYVPLWCPAFSQCDFLKFLSNSSKHPIYHSSFLHKSADRLKFPRANGFCNGYHLVMTNSLPWKITIFNR